MDDDNWETTFLEELTDSKDKGASSGSGMEMNEEDSDFDDRPVVPKLRTYIMLWKMSVNFWSTKDMGVKPCQPVHLLITLFI